MPVQESGNNDQKKGFDWVFIFMCIGLGVVVVYLVRRVQAMEKQLQKLQKEADHTIGEEEISDAVKYYLDNNPYLFQPRPMEMAPPSPSFIQSYPSPITMPPGRGMPYPPMNFPMQRTNIQYPQTQMHSPIPIPFPNVINTPVPNVINTPVSTKTVEQHPSSPPKQEERVYGGTNETSEEVNFHKKEEVVCDGDICYVVAKEESKEEINKNSSDWKTMDLIQGPWYGEKEEIVEETMVTRIPFVNVLKTTGDSQLDNMVGNTLNALWEKIQESKVEHINVDIIDFGDPSFEIEDSTAIEDFMNEMTVDSKENNRVELLEDEKEEKDSLNSNDKIEQK